MTDTLLPIIRQMHDAETDAARARLLLNVPDLVLAKYEGVFAQACRRARFDLGEQFILLRVNSLRAVRDDIGNLPKETAIVLKDFRTAMIAAAAGEAQ